MKVRVRVRVRARVRVRVSAVHLIGQLALGEVGVHLVPPLTLPLTHVRAGLHTEGPAREDLVRVGVRVRVRVGVGVRVRVLTRVPVVGHDRGDARSRGAAQRGGTPGLGLGLG